MALPLSGLLVVSVEQAVAAPQCTCRLADAGARVIKVERPEGDFAREYDHVVHGESANFVWLNRGKQSVVLDLGKAEDKALLEAMLKKADVFVQNLKPGALAKLGFPMPEVMVWVAILIEVGGAALLILGWQTRRVAWLFILFVVIATLMAHRFWEFSDAAQYAAQLNNFLKNLAVLGGLLYIAAFGAGALSMDGRARTS